MSGTPSITRKVACFISPHGLGHAARTAAVLAALQRREAGLGIECFSVAPAEFFSESGCHDLTLHNERVDIGFAQKSALVEDIPETVRQLDAFLPFPSDLVDRLAATVSRAGCVAAICDISPLGIAAARAAGIPSVLIENFTWDNLYDHYVPEHPRLGSHAATLRKWFDAADVHIQTEPVCHRVARTALTTCPVSRPPRNKPALVRDQLGIKAGQRMVLITMGGISERTPMLAHLAKRDDLVFVVAFGAACRQRVGNVIALPLRSEFYHPDLVHAADAVIGKVGYSTLAEVQRAGAPFGYISRQNYPEMPALVRYIEQTMPGLAFQAADLGEAGAGDTIDRLLALPRRPPTLANGAVEIAEFLQDLVSEEIGEAGRPDRIQ